MASGDYFTGSCTPLHRLNCTTTLPWMIDPCSCYKYYQCDTNKDAKLRDCPSGTEFDHQKESCVRDVILSGNCQVNAPWKRCGLNDEATTQLMQRCTNTSTIPPPNSIAPPNKDTPSDTGLILGTLFGVLFVLICVVLLAVLLQRRKEMKKKDKLTKKLSVQNPEYNLTVDDEEETYNVIDDKMHDPVYNNNSDSTSKPPTLPYRPEEDDDKTRNPDTFDYKVINKHNKETLQSETNEISSGSLDKSKVITSGQKDDNEPEHDYSILSDEERSREQTDTLSSGLSDAPEPSPYDNSWGVKISGVQVSD